METQITSHALPPAEREWKFNPERKWRFDFAWPSQYLALEIEGGTWNRGRHTRGSGFKADCEKYNHATLLGWRVLRVTGDQVREGQAVQWLMEALGEWSIHHKNVK